MLTSKSLLSCNHNTMQYAFTRTRDTS